VNPARCHDGVPARIVNLAARRGVEARERSMIREGATADPCGGSAIEQHPTSQVVTWMSLQPSPPAGLAAALAIQPRPIPAFVRRWRSK
jgi:hypothetical protein